MDAGLPSITIDQLGRRFGAAGAPLIVDVRRHAIFEAADRSIAGALRGDPAALEDWGPRLPRGMPVVVACVHGHEVSQRAAAALRRLGYDACYLEGGIEAWSAAGLPDRATAAMRAAGAAPTRWITRERPKIDRIACPWAIRRFVDPQAEFLYVPADRVLAEAERQGAIPFDIPGVAFGHVGERCSFDAVIAHFGLRDAALERLSVIVRGADTGRPALAPEAAGLVAVSLGLSTLFADDHVMLEHGLRVYDALYAWAARAADERHNWKPAA